MIISFFEEFPKKENLEKIKLVSWPTKLYIAARNIGEFEKAKSNTKSKFVKEHVYWPILDKKEGYWISPFSKREALVRVSNEIKNRGTPLMLDLELPTTMNLQLYAREALNFLANRKLIKNIVTKHKKVYSCEYYPDGITHEKMLEVLGLHFNPKKLDSKIIKMVYHSMHKFDEGFITKEIERGKKQFGNRFIVAYGTIAEGIKGNEPMLQEKQLKKDLEIAEDKGVEEVIIYRLGGLNRKYCSVIKKFCD